MGTLDRFYHQITGSSDAPKLVFLHGVMGFAANWRRIAKAFEDDFQVLTYDQRGHGRSFHPESGYRIEDYAADLEDILNQLGWREIHLVGHSMGGRVAYRFACERPKRVTRLVIEDIGPSMNPEGASFIVQMLDTVPTPFASKREAKRWFDEEFPRIFKAQPNPLGLAAFLFMNIIENDQKQAVWRFAESGIRESVRQGRARERWDDIRALAMPTLVVRGEYSRDLPREIYDKMLQINPRIQGVEISSAGHWVHSDQPEAFIAALRQFFVSSV